MFLWDFSLFFFFIPFFVFQLSLSLFLCSLFLCFLFLQEISENLTLCTRQQIIQQHDFYDEGRYQEISMKHKGIQFSCFAQPSVYLFCTFTKSNKKYSNRLFWNVKLKDVGSYLTEQAMQILDIDQMLVCHLRGVVERRGIEVLIETCEGNSPFNCSAQAEVSLVKKCLHNINFSKCASKLGDPLC